jgi:hypothetical protein
MTFMVDCKSLALTLGLNQEGQPMQLQYLASPTRKLYVVPGEFAILVTHSLDGNDAVQEFPFEKYYSWTYVPYKQEETPEDEITKVFGPNDVREEEVLDAPDRDLN